MLKITARTNLIILFFFLIVGGGFYLVKNLNLSFVSKASAQISSKDAIAIRVIPNTKHYSAQRWYKEKQFSGSPQSFTVDGYEAVRDGRTVYVNAANIDTENGNFYTNIYLISYNQEAQSPTVDIFAKILSHWKFNSNLANQGNCRKEGLVCTNDTDCSLYDFCDSMKARVIRDTRRLADIVEINSILKTYQGDDLFPSLSAGTYLPNKTLSVWPSWQETLADILGARLPVDPVNELGACGAAFNRITCWNEVTKQFATNFPVLPQNSLAYSYQFISDINGTSTNICATLESGLTITGDLVISSACPSACLDFDRDTYVLFNGPACPSAPLDCDDSNDRVHSGFAESPNFCNDLLDNDCDGFTDCNDPECPPCNSPSPCNNDGNCDFGETCALCPIGDGCCAAELCPNGVCDTANNECITCPSDCTGFAGCCGRDGCNISLGECWTNPCPSDCQVSDCCGDGHCADLLIENSFTCPQDCAPTCVDADGDGYDNCSPGDPGDDGRPVDCRDNDPDIYPNAPEICDGKNNDCQGTIADEGLSAEDCGFVCMLTATNDYNMNRSGNLRCCGNDANEGQPYQSTETNCTDGRDNDCNGLTDNLAPPNGPDPACAGTCAGIFTNERLWYVAALDPDCNQCDHEGDDDGDQSPGNWSLYPGMADQCDGDCNPLISGSVSFADYQHGAETACDDDIDNDCDGFPDCADSDCASDPHCLPTCSDGITLYGQCYAVPPYYCDNSGNRVENCTACGCTGTWVCGQDGTFCCDNTCNNVCSPLNCDAAHDPDCGTGGCCGDGTCNPTESNSSCPADCPASCVPDNCNGNCPPLCTDAEDPDCGTGGCCGDGTCNPTESNSSCPADCPASCVPDNCNGNCPPLCTDAEDPDCGTGGCCGDGTCNPTESNSSCPADCLTNICQFPITFPCVFP